MIVRHDGGKREIWSVWTTLAATILATRFESSAGSAAARSVLGAVTPETLGLGEEVMIRWSYDDGNGGMSLPGGQYSSVCPLLQVQYLVCHVARMA